MLSSASSLDVSAQTPQIPETPAGHRPPELLRTSGLGRRATLDLLWVGFLGVAVFLVGMRLEFFERIVQTLGHWEGLQADEAVLGLFVLLLGSVWFALRRWHEAETESRQRREAQAEVASLLDRNRQLLNEMVQVQERERAEIGRELHDELGQLITAMRVETSAMSCFVSRADLPACCDSVATLRRLAESMHGEVRDLLQRVRPWGLEELGLGAVLRSHVATWQRQQSARCNLHLEETQLAGLPLPISTAVFRLVQEALTNVARHSGAGQVNISVRRDPGHPADNLGIDIADDGAGTTRPESSGGLGLVGMRERIGALGGTCTVRTAPGQGFRISARIPLPHT